LHKFPISLCVIAAALTLLASCARRPAAPATPAAPPPYIRIEPSTKSAPNKLAIQQGATDKELGIAFYPGAKVNKSGLVEGPKGNIAGAELQTTEPYASVVKFYRDKYATQKPSLQTVDDPAGTITMLNWQDMRGNYTVIIKRDNAGKRTVVTLAKTSK
jgi:hypothetical protein